MISWDYSLDLLGKFKLKKRYLHSIFYFIIFRIKKQNVVNIKSTNCSDRLLAMHCCFDLQKVRLVAVTCCDGQFLRDYATVEASCIQILAVFHTTEN